MSTALERINEMTIAHQRETVDFYIGQTKGLGDLLFDVIRALGVKQFGGELGKGDVLVFGMYRGSDILVAARELRGFSPRDIDNENP